MNPNNNEKTRVIHVESLNSKTHSNILLIIFQFMLLFMSLTGFVYCVSTSLMMSIGIIEISLMSFPCLLICALFTLSKKVYIPFICIFGAAIVFILGFMTSLRKLIFDSFTFCYNLTIKLVIDEGYTNYKSAMTEDITEKLTNTQYVTNCFYCVIIVLIVLFSVIFTSSMFKKSLLWICVLPCFIILTPSLYFGAVPSGSAFCIFIAGIIGCYIEQIAYGLNNRKSENKIKSSDNKKSKQLIFSASVNAFCISAIVLCVSLGVLCAVYSKEVPQVESVREFIDNIATKITNKLFYEKYESSEGAIGGLLDGNILELKTPKFRDLPVMTVTTETNTSLYLRGWIASDLEQNGWVILDEKDTEKYHNKVSKGFDQYTQFYRYTKFMSKTQMESASSAQDTVKLGFIYDNVTMKSVFKKSLMMFVPIAGIDTEVKGKYRGITKLGDTISFFEDKRPNSNTYSIRAAVQDFSDRDFYLGFKEEQEDYLFMAKAVQSKTTGRNDEEQFMYDERKYKEYVDDTYTSIPENSSFLSGLATELTRNYQNNFDKVLELERYFKTKYTYAQKFTSVEGSALDKVKYMINTSKTGYCTYFATAMTVMVRSLGVPARYVSGYHAMTVADTGDTKYVRNIKDNNYHAWVEVYFDGIGWLTFDPTPGMGGQQVIRDYGYLDEAPTESEDTPKPNEDTPEDTEEEDNEEEDKEEGNTGNEMPVPKYKLPGWIIFLIVAISALTFIIVSIAVSIIAINNNFNKFRASIDSLNPTAKVKKLYPCILALLHLIGYSLQAGETIYEFAGRVDCELNTAIPLSSIIGTMEMTQFSHNFVDENRAQLIVKYYDNLYVSMLYGLNTFKKYYYMATINKKRKR